MEIAEIKQRLTIGEVLNHYNLQADKNKMLCCPFHDDKKPSMQVYAETNTVHCFSGNCEHTGKAIDVIDFILYKEKCSKHEAILKCKALLGERGIVKKQEVKEENYTEVFKKLQASVARSGKAQNYLKERNLHDAKLEVGFNSGKLFSKLRDCVIFPLRNQANEIVSFYGRSVDRKQHYYLENREGLYPKYPDKETEILILTESVIDSATISLYLPTGQADTDYPTLALYGTNGLTQEHVRAIASATALKEIVFFLDGDQAGRKAVEKYSQQLKEQFPGITISQVETPDGEDANSLVQSHPPEVGQVTENILTHLIEQRKPLFSKEERSLKNSDNPSTAENSSKSFNTTNPDYIVYKSESVTVSVLGGIGLYPLDKLKVTLKLTRDQSNNPLHNIRQSIDLYQDDYVEKLTRKASERLELGSKEVMLVLAELTTKLENYRAAEIEKKKVTKPQKRILTKQQEDQAIKFLSSRDLLKHTNELIGKSGMVGEENNRLLMYLVFTSRLRNHPLHIVSLGASGTGKTYLQEKIAELIPEDEKLEITALSENALYYFDRKELKNKLVLIEDLDGASDDKVLFAIRELQSKKKISKTIPIKDDKGNWKTITLQVEGPISLAGTTTREKLYEDNANRSLLIYLDSSKQHKEAIMEYQRAVSAGQINKAKEDQVKEFFKDMQTVLKPVEVRNPYAMKLKIPETVFKPLRTNAHYLAFIEMITFYHQYQRQTKQDPTTGQYFIETTIEDIRQANGMLKEVLLSKSDELTKACRDFFERLKSWLIAENLPAGQAGKESFYSKQLRVAFRMSPTTLNRHLLMLLKYGHIQILGGNKKSGYEYEVTDIKEYNKLQRSVGNALDQALVQLNLPIT